MFEKVAKFRMLASRRPAPDLIAPANDNRRGVRPGASRRARTPRLICRWSLPEGAKAPVCRWMLESSDEPSPSSRRVPLSESAFHKTVLRLSYQGRAAGTALRDADVTSDAKERLRATNARSVLHARH